MQNIHVCACVCVLYTQTHACLHAAYTCANTHAHTPAGAERCIQTGRQTGRQTHRHRHRHTHTHTCRCCALYSTEDWLPLGLERSFSFVLLSIMSLGRPARIHTHTRMSAPPSRPTHDKHTHTPAGADGNQRRLENATYQPHPYPPHPLQYPPPRPNAT